MLRQTEFPIPARANNSLYLYLDKINTALSLCCNLSFWVYFSCIQIFFSTPDIRPIGKSLVLVSFCSPHTNGMLNGFSTPRQISIHGSLLSLNKRSTKNVSVQNVYYCIVSVFPQFLNPFYSFLLLHTPVHWKLCGFSRG